MVNWVLGPLSDPSGYEERVARKAALLDADAWCEPGPGSPVNQYRAAAGRGDFAERVLAQFPALRDRGKEFAVSDQLRHMPALRYPALFRAALATMPGRRGQPGDGYDIAHLTRGLSRCDIVTADKGMTQILRERRIVPIGCQLFSFREVAALHCAIEAALSQGGRRCGCDGA